MSRARRVICGLIAGILIRVSFYPISLLQKTVCLVWALTLILFGAISDEKLAKIKAECRKEWWEKQVDEEKWK